MNSSTKYDPKSSKAEEFINHQEILETLDYAEKNRENFELIDAIIEKARKKKGISTETAKQLLLHERRNSRINIELTDPEADVTFSRMRQN